MFPVSDDNKKASYRREGKIVRKRKRDRDNVVVVIHGLVVVRR